MRFAKILSGATEKLYEDEGLRSNLSDEEAKVVLDWAAKWIEGQITAAPDEASARRIAGNEMLRLRRVLKAINGIAQDSAVPSLSNTLAVIQAQALENRALTRAQVFRLLTLLVGEMWRM